MTHQLADVVIENHGSILLIDARTAAAREWVAYHLSGVEVQQFGGKVAAEPRYVAAIVAGMREDGLIVR